MRPYCRPNKLGGIVMVAVTHHDEEQAFRDICLHSDEIITRKITMQDLRQSLREGWQDYSEKPISTFTLLILYYPLFAVIFVMTSMGQDLRYLIFPAVAGFTLIGPVIAIAFFEMSRQKENGLRMSWRKAFGFIHSYSFAPILGLSIVMTMLYAGWLYLAEALYFSLFADTPPASVADFFNQLVTTRHGWALIFYGNLIGFLFSFAAMAFSVIAFPLALDKPVTTLTAVAVSVKAFLDNVWVLGVWGFIVVLIMALGAALFFVGLAVALPILGHATWHLYKKIVALEPTYHHNLGSEGVHNRRGASVAKL